MPTHFPYDPNEFSAGPQIDGLYQDFPMPGAAPVAAPSNAESNLGLGNNLETWLAGIQLLGGLMQPVGVGETTGGVAGKALAGAANTFGQLSGAKAKAKAAQAAAAEDKRKDVETNPSEAAEIAYKNALAWKARNPSSTATAAGNDAIERKAWIEAYAGGLQKQHTGMSREEAIRQATIAFPTRKELAVSGTPEALASQAALKTAEAFGDPEDTRNATSSVDQFRRLQTGKQALPDVTNPAERTKLETLLSTEQGRTLAEETYGPGIYKLLYTGK